MAKFKGKNTISSTIKLYLERALFHLLAYDGINADEGVKDLTYGEI